MAWNALTREQVLQTMSEQEQTLVLSNSIDEGLDTILQGVIALVRAYVQTYQPNQSDLGDVGTIPDETLPMALAICRYKFLTVLPGTQLITKWRELENEQAYGLLESVSTGAIKIVGAISGEIPQYPGEFGGECLFPVHLGEYPWPYGWTSGDGPPGGYW